MSENALQDNTIKNKDYFLCPYCFIQVPIILSISYEGNEQFIEFKCKCGTFKESLASLIEKMKDINIYNIGKCISCSHSEKKAECYCYSCNRSLCKNCFDVHLTFFEEHIPFGYRLDISNKDGIHNENECEFYCRECNEAFCTECSEEHSRHEREAQKKKVIQTKEKMKEIIELKLLHDYNQWDSMYNTFIEYVESTYSEVIGKAFPDESIKQNIISEYESAKKRITYEFYLIKFTYANYYSNQNSIVNMHNILMIPEILPLYCDERIKNNNELYINYLQSLSFYDKNANLTYAFLVSRFNAILNLNNDGFQRQKIYDIKRIYKLTGIYFGEERNYSREGVGIQINHGKRIEGIWQNDQSSEGKIISKDYIYIGALANEIENGKGVANYSNSIYKKYIGYFVNGEKTKGIMMYANGEEYEGEFENNKKNGKGRYKYNNGIYDNYDGEWKDDKKQGKGTLTFYNFDVYKGDFDNDKCNGYGEYYVSTGGEFKGNWVDNYKEGKGEETWPDGDKYEGEYHKSIFEGKGKFSFSNGEEYEGDFKNGLFNGKGKYTWPNGQKYEGDFVDGICSGKGKQTFIDCSEYDGEWKNDTFEGKGILKYKNGTIYEGEFKKGEIEGFGKMLKGGHEYIGTFNGGSITGKDVTINYGNGDKYIGEVNSFLKTGKGTYTFKNGATYSGDWDGDKANGTGTFCSHYYYLGPEYTNAEENPMTTIYEGYGIYIKTNGKQYIGNWKNGKRSEKGKMFWPNGEEYDGDWSNEMRNGFGVNNWIDGERYEGTFKDNQFDGQGTMTYKDGIEYNGDWKDDMYNGKGVMTWPSGQVYDGHFKDNKFEGYGELTYADGRQYKGGFVNDCFEGKGVFTWINGEKYDGDWVNNRRHGNGKMEYVNGDVYNGEWEEDKKQGRGRMQYATGRTYNGEWRDDKEKKKFLGLF